MALSPSASYSLTVRMELERRPGAFAAVAAAIGKAGGLLGAVDLVRAERSKVVRDVTISASGLDHASEIVEAIKAGEHVSILHVSDRTFLLHMGGKLETGLRVPLESRDDLSMAYTPGVARVCTAIHDDPVSAWNLTIKGNTVAVVSDGTAVLGLGDIGPEAAMPVMEGKAMLFKAFGGVDAFPICLDTTDPDEIVNIVKNLAPTFGGINLEDIAAPRCFEIEARLEEILDIPVFHDDQHGTAVVVLAALINALRVVGKKPEDIKVVVSGAGAAGVACADMMAAYGVKDIVGADSKGIVSKDRPDLNSSKVAFAERTNPRGLRGDIAEAMKGADVVIGVSQPDAFTVDMVKTMAEDSIVFAMANPVPEVPYEEVHGLAAVVGTGRSDYPNQINNVLAFPGIFRGALSVRARKINKEMQLAAAEAIADILADDIGPDYIIPGVFDRRVADAVAERVAKAAIDTGVARRETGAAPGAPSAPSAALNASPEASAAV